MAAPSCSWGKSAEQRGFPVGMSAFPISAPPDMGLTQQPPAHRKPHCRGGSCAGFLARKQALGANFGAVTAWQGHTPPVTASVPGKGARDDTLATVTCKEIPWSCYLHGDNMPYIGVFPPGMLQGPSLGLLCTYYPYALPGASSMPFVHPVRRVQAEHSRKQEHWDIKQSLF